MSPEREPAQEMAPDARRAYFEQLAHRYRKQMRLLFRGGKLKKKEGWRNVVEHCVVQLAAAEVLADLLGLSPEETQQICTVAAVHDWSKRMDVAERKAQSQEERGEIQDRRKMAESFTEQIDIDADLMHATDPEFLRHALVEKKASLLQKIQFYLDDICGTRNGKADIIPPRERIAEVAARRQDLNDDPALTARLGGKYWDREQELVAAVEEELWKRLKDRGHSIQSPEELPAFIRAEIQKRMK